MCAFNIPGVGVTKLFPSREFPNFSEVLEHWLPTDYHVHTWWESPQHWGDICQIWMWFDESNIYVCNILNFQNEEINERRLSSTYSVQ